MQTQVLQNISDQETENIHKEKERFDINRKYPKLKFAHKEGGLYLNYEKNSIGASVIADILKQIGQKVAKGQVKNLMQISKPIQLCKDITQTEFVAYDNHTTQYLDLAAQANEDPVLRMKYVMTFLISTIRCGVEKLFTRIPLDPTIGETSQLRKENGTMYFAEAIGVTPPEILVNMVGPNNKWRLECHHKVKAQLILPKMNDIDAAAQGYKKIFFNDGTEILLEHIFIHLGGLFMGDRTMRVQKNCRVIDLKNNLQGEFIFNYNREGTMSKLSKSFSGLFNSSQKKKKSIDSFNTFIYQYDNEQENKKSFFNHELNNQGLFGNYQEQQDTKKLVSEGSGNYTSYLQFDNQIFWTIEQETPSWINVSLDKLLMSDAFLRMDKLMLEKKQTKQATIMKQEIESQELKDEQLRQQKPKKV